MISTLAISPPRGLMTTVCLRFDDLIDISAANPEPAMVPSNSPSEILPTT